MSQFTLREYQTEAIAAVEASWQEGINRPSCILSTGAGKTVVFSALIANHIDQLRKNGQRVLVLAHREELLEQAEDKIKKSIPGVWTQVVKANRGSTSHQFADVIVASVQTLARPKRREVIDRIGMVIVDECHRAASRSYLDVLNHYGCMDERQTPTVGFTATMTRMQGGLPDVWQSIAYSKPIKWMVENGYLIRPTTKTIVVPGMSLAQVRTTAGDLNTKDIAQAMRDNDALDIIADRWMQDAAGRPTITFMPDVATTQLMNDAFLERGITSEFLVGSTGSRERRAMIDRYNAGETMILNSCGVLTEGFDAPLTSCVIVGRPTINPGLFVQMIGRGLRLHPGKTDCLVIDMAGASLKHTLAGVNDLESDCESGTCECNCLSCGCGTRCKCGIRECGCTCVEQHKVSNVCRCANTADCPCGCGNGGDDEDVDHCFCDDSKDCACFEPAGDADELSKDADTDKLRELVEVDILATELKSSSFTWLKTNAGISFLTVGPAASLFLLPDPNSEGFFLGRVDGHSSRAKVTRLDDGAVPADVARKRLEELADATGYSYNSKRSTWRRTPASQAQLQILHRMGVPMPGKLKKGEASDMLSIDKVSRAIDSRFGRYVTK